MRVPKRSLSSKPSVASKLEGNLDVGLDANSGMWISKMSLSIKANVAPNHGGVNDANVEDVVPVLKDLSRPK